MSQFKPGDKVTPVNVYCDNDVMEQFVGKTLLVLSVGNEVVCAGVPGEGDWYWHSDDLRLVSETKPEPAPAASQKPIRRGDLVEYDGRVCVVFSDRDLVGHFFVSALSGVSDYYHCSEEELTRIGSILKNIKRIRSSL